MHGSEPKLLIIARREAAGDEMPDFSGPDFLQAKKTMVHGAGCAPEQPSDTLESLRAEIQHLSERLDQLSGETSSSEDDKSGDEEVGVPDEHHGEAKGLK